jgi:hypothetical protein
VPSPESATADRVLAAARRAIALILVLAMAGIFVELLLIEHFEDAWQFVPLVLLVLGVVVVAWHMKAPSRTSHRLLQGTMGAFVLAGVLGLYLHFAGNVEFELEQTPNATRWVLFREAMMGATPALAPGVMIQLGLLGLVLAYIARVGRPETPDV